MGIWGINLNYIQDNTKNMDDYEPVYHHENIIIEYLPRESSILMEIIYHESLMLLVKD